MRPAVQTTSSVHSSALHAFESQFQERAADALIEVREAAMDRFMKLGLPTMRDETWRYTSLRDIGELSLADAPSRIDQGIEPNASLSLIGESDRAASVLMVNGHPMLPQSIDYSINNIDINSLREMSRLDPAAVSAFLDVTTDSDAERWALLNTALFVDGLHLKIASIVTTPLVILHLSTAAKDGTVSYPRVIIECAAGASATIIEHHVGQGDFTPLVNSVTNISLGPNAQLDHYRVFATDFHAKHIDSLIIRQHEHSRCKQFTIALGGAMVRSSLSDDLAHADATLESFALLVGDESRHVDCVSIARHNAPRTVSSQTARAIAGGSSRVVFNSKVIVNEGAMHAESRQSVRGLLLSSKAEIDSRPQLEIHTDEVKCSHGATTGRLDPDMLFYMLSRGLDRETAQSLLIFAFLADVLKDMSIASARSAIENALIARLPDSDLLQKFR